MTLPIYLIGYMGTGKSTIGHELAHFLVTKAAGCEDTMFCDTAFIIEVEESDIDNITKSLESIINIMKGWKK